MFCGLTWERAVKEYKQTLIKVQRWHGADKASAPFSIQQMYDYMDTRRRMFNPHAFSTAFCLICSTLFLNCILLIKIYCKCNCKAKLKGNICCF